MTITGPDARSAAPGQAVVDAAMLVLERMGLTPADLLAAPAARAAAPTFAEYIPVVSALVSDGCRKAYGSYWNRVVEQWGSRGIDEPTPSEIRSLAKHVRANVVPRRNSRGGRSAAEHLIAALRCMYKHAEEDGLISRDENPARKVEKPRRLPSTRRAVADKRLAEINHTAATTGDDPELYTLMLRLHTEKQAAGAARWRCARRTSTPSSASSCCARKARPSGGSQSRPPSWPPSCGTPGNATRLRTGSCGATATAAASPTAAMPPGGTGAAGTCPGYGRSRSACTGSGTRP